MPVAERTYATSLLTDIGSGAKAYGDLSMIEVPGVPGLPYDEGTGTLKIGKATFKYCTFLRFDLDTPLLVNDVIAVPDGATVRKVKLSLWVASPPVLVSPEGKFRVGFLSPDGIFNHASSVGFAKASGAGRYLDASYLPYPTTNTSDTVTAGKIVLNNFVGGLDTPVEYTSATTGLISIGDEEYEPTFALTEASSVQSMTSFLQGLTNIGERKIGIVLDAYQNPASSEYIDFLSDDAVFLGTGPGVWGPRLTVEWEWDDALIVSTPKLETRVSASTTNIERLTPAAARIHQRVGFSPVQPSEEPFVYPLDEEFKMLFVEGTENFDGLNGWFDPSIIFPVPAVGYICITSASGLMLTAAQYLSTYIGKSGDGGIEWYFQTIVFRSKDSPDPNAQISVFSDSDVDTGADTITFATTDDYADGQLVRFVAGAGTLPAPFAEGTLYAIRVVSAGVFAFYASASDAVADTSRIDITTVGSGSNNVINANWEQPPGRSDTDGFYHYEVPTLIYDPTDPDPNAIYKCIAYKIYWTETNRNFPQYSYYTMRTAASPEGPWYPDYDTAEIPWMGYGPRMGAVKNYLQHDLSLLDPELSTYVDEDLVVQNFVSFSEPFWAIESGNLYFGSSALGLTGSEFMFLIKSTDHGATWTYQGKLATKADAVLLGYEHLEGGCIYEDSGTYYLMVTPSRTPTATYARHDGTMVLEIEDITASPPTLVRDIDGVPVVRRRVYINEGINSGNHGGGQAGFDPDQVTASGGIYYSQINLGSAPKWAKVYKSGVRYP